MGVIIDQANPGIDVVDDDFDLTLEAGRSERHYWMELWRFRELFIVLAARDISVRYKQTLVGVAWAVIQPVLSMIIMTVIFGRVAGLHTDPRTPYAILVFAAMLPWMFFSSSLSTASQSIVANASLISKIYFPRLLIPVSAIITCLADFFISFVVLAVLMLWYSFTPTWNILSLPVFIGLGILASLGPGLMITALNVKYRDFRYVIPFAVQFGLYISPVGYSSSVIREKFGETLFLLYSLNPMVGVIDGFRWAILGPNAPVYLPGFFVSLAVSCVLAAVGLWYFRKTEQGFADVI